MKTVNIVVDWGVIRLPSGTQPRPGSSGQPAAESEPGTEQKGRGLRILMVEDDPALSMMYRVRLEAAGYTVALATDGEEGLRQITEGAGFDLVFLDVGLPGIDGLAVLESIRNSTQSETVPVVILSNYNEPPMRQRGLSLGALAYLVKSEITPSWLVARIPGWAKR
ncbi:MAG TPA: response regulator [Candidatus Dormibacteraeota bacterium]|jgi:DNA-binding response OmpR family regulator|nr:response regulator [Candidatus Dormibacteraeota bacterium]